MRISDWSSDVCSSDLPVEKRCPFRQAAEAGQMEEGRAGALAPDAAGMTVHIDGLGGERGHGLLLGARASRPLSREARSEERRVGEGWVSQCRYRWSPVH